MKPEKKSAPVPFHPPLIAAFPVLSLYSANLALLPASNLVPPLAQAVGITVLIWAVAALVLRSVARGAAAATAAVVMAYAYVPITNAIPSLYLLRWQPIVWGVLLVVLMGLAAWRKFTLPLNVIAACLTLSVLGSIGWGFLKIREDLAGVAARSGPHATGGATPDVFYIILDGHGRSDSIKRFIGADDSAFVEGLRKRGFYVADRSHSNYVQTQLSLSSSLNFDLLPNLLTKIDPASTDRAPLDHLVDDNALKRFLEGRGYRSIAVSTEFPPFQFLTYDLRLGYHSGTNLLLANWTARMPWGQSDDATGSMFTRRREVLLEAFTNLKNLAPHTSRPRFVFAHILAPHPPFVFGPEGETRPHHGPFGYMDASDFLNFGKPKDYRQGYSGQVHFMDKMTLEAVDALLAAPGPKPIIVIQGDHGSKLHLDQASLAHTDVRECFPNLAALYVPEVTKSKLYPGITPVNEFRVILNTVYGTDLPLRPDQSWYSSFLTPYRFEAVATSQIDPPPGSAASRAPSPPYPAPTLPQLVGQPPPSDE